MLQSVRSLRSILPTALQGIPVTVDQHARLKGRTGEHYTPAAGRAVMSTEESINFVDRMASIC